MCCGVVIDDVDGVGGSGIAAVVVRDGGSDVADNVVVGRGNGGVVAGVLIGDGGSDRPIIGITVVFDGGIEVLDGVVVDDDISSIVVMSSLVMTLMVL